MKAACFTAFSAFGVSFALQAEAAHFNPRADPPPPRRASLDALTEVWNRLDEQAHRARLDECSRGLLASCVEAARWSERDGDYDRVVDTYNKACHSGVGRACTHLARLYKEGRGVPRDPERAAELWANGCRQRDGWSCLMLAQTSALTSPPDERKAKAQLTNACKLDVAPACVALAEVGRRILASSCQRKGYLACSILGYFFDSGMAGATNAKQAVRYYTLACDGGDADGCHNLGLSLYAGRGIQKDVARAVALFVKACKAQSRNGCLSLAFQYFPGGFLGVNYEKAIQLLEPVCVIRTPDSCRFLGQAYYYGRKDSRAAVHAYEWSCDEGESEGCERLGAHLLYGEGIVQDKVRASLLLRKGCDENSGFACYHLAQQWFDIDKPQAALPLWAKACTLGSQDACVELGELHLFGKGTPRDEQAAFKVFDASCKASFAPACTELGVLYQHGWGVAADEQRATALFQSSCDGGSAAGCTWLAFALETGAVLGKDLARAIALLEQSCKEGFNRGCVELGIRYHDGKGLNVDLGRARDLYEQACSAKEPLGCTWLGILYRFGEGVTLDSVRARGLFTRACNDGEALACNNLASMTLRGYGGQRDVVAAVSLYRKACVKDDAQACGAFGLLVLMGQASANDWSDARTFTAKGCKLGSTDACKLLERFPPERH